MHDARSLFFCALLLLACGEAQESASTVESPAADLAAQQVQPIGWIDAERLIAADSEPGNWLGHGRTYDEQRFSPLSQIDVSNVSQLGLAWSFELDSTRGVEATPIVVDGVMYLTGTWSRVYALDATNGELLWKYDPQVPGDWARHLCCDIVNRGVAVWEGSVFVGTLDGRLLSLDAGSGELNWEVLTIDPSRPYSITGAPRVVKGKVLIGNGGAEMGVRGYFSAYDAKTGDQVWRFYTVPGDPSEPFEHAELEAAAKTWTGQWWVVGGGGTAWDAMAYDPELDLLYVGTGNGSPWTRSARSPGGGDNLYLCAILAVRPDTGELVWHYQTTPGEAWDYTSTQHILLADLEIAGRERKVLMQAPKNGFFYVLDRVTGELLSAEPYVAVNWATHVDLKSGRPVETEDGDYRNNPREIYPAPNGAHSWHPMSYHPGTGLVYFPARDIHGWYVEDPDFEYLPGSNNLGLHPDLSIELAETQTPPLPTAKLLAWDPVAQREVWSADKAGAWNGGVLSTAGGLVFQGSGDGRFVAYDASTGAELWEVRSQTGIMAPPVTYTVNGEQYVVVAAGYGGGITWVGRLPETAIENYHNEGRVLAFKLGAGAAIPTNQPRDQRVPRPPTVTASAEEIAHGKAVYHRHCFICHGLSARGSWIVPDLRYLSPERYEGFEAIVLGGALSGKGMPDFKGFVSREDLKPLQAYIVSESQKIYDAQQASGAL